MITIAESLLREEDINYLCDAVQSYTADKLLATAYSLPNIAGDKVQLMMLRGLFSVRAKSLGCSKQINDIFKAYDMSTGSGKPTRVVNSFVDGDFRSFLKYGKDGRVEPTAPNFLMIMQNDEHYENVRFNMLGNYAEIHHELPGSDGISVLKISRWTDADEAESRTYLEEVYGISNERKHNDALRLLFREREYNPVIDYLKKLQWDGTERIEDFLHRWMLADDSPYIRECSRLIFAGGINRIMNPGCKMDDVVVLVGGQGTGKSTIVRMLAMDDTYFGEIKTVDGDKAVEQLAGKWICEIPELSAFTRAKEVESIKAFITRQKDSYRKPYDRNVDDRDRMCVMIGTTNNPAFLIDQTGNRRYYPVHVRSNAYDLYRHKAEIEDYIRQCWAEALVKFKRHEMPNFAREDLIDEYRKAQDAATQDDWRIGAIEAYLYDKPIGSFACVKELMDEVISPDREHPLNPTPKDSKDISIIMSRMEGWEKAASSRRTMKYGTQRGWVKVSEKEPYGDIPVADSGGLPF